MVRSRWQSVVSAFGLAPLAVWMAAGQAPGIPAQLPASGPIPTFQANANLVLVDVVVRDHGHPVLGLQQSDFEVLQDGKPQAITVFEEHKATDVQESPKPPALPPHVYSDFPQDRITSAANVLLLDALNTPQNDQTFARAQMLQYLRTLPAGTQIAVFTLASRLRMVSGFTTDVASVEEALNPKNNPAQPSILLPSSSDVAAEKQIGESISGGIPEGDAIPEMDHEVSDFQRDRQAFQHDQRMDITLAAFSQLARYLSAIPGRKNLIWVSGGLSGALDPDLSRMSAAQATRFGPAIRVVNSELTRARVAVYPVDARAQMALPDSNLANATAPVESGTNRDLQAAEGEGMQNDIAAPQQWGDSQQEMKRVAADTGGAAFFNTNAVGKAVETAIADGENYYTLGYAPQRAAGDGAFHRIEVRTNGKKYELAYRRGYFAVDPGQSGQPTPMLSPIAQAMEPGVPPLSQLIFEARVLPAGDPELRGLEPSPGPAGKPAQPLEPPVTRYFVDYSIDPHRLALRDLPDGRRQVELEVTQAVYGPGGKRLNFTDAGLEFNLTPAQIAHDMQSGVRARQEIDVPSGPVWMRLGVRDATSGRIGTLEFALKGKP